MLTSNREGAQEEKEAEDSWRIRVVEFRKEEGRKGQEEMSGWCYGHFGGCHCLQQPTSRERAIVSPNRHSLPLDCYDYPALVVNPWRTHPSQHPQSLRTIQYSQY